MKIDGISETIVDALVKRSNKLGQGRTVGTIGFVDGEGYISKCSEITNGGLSGLPFRKLLSGAVSRKGGSLLELIDQLPGNAVIISSAPGKTGIIISTGGINIFDQPVVNIGIKNNEVLGAGILYPESKFFNLASISEKVQLKTLSALNMEEEREAMRESTELRLKYLEISDELPIVDTDSDTGFQVNSSDMSWKRPELRIEHLDLEFAEYLVNKSMAVEQGREVAAIGLVDESGRVIKAGEIIVGGMGYIPSRLLASSYKDITDISLRQAYKDIIPDRAVVVHTHPGGTGVMHMGDAMAIPGTWGRPIIAVGHDENGKIKGATTVEFSKQLSLLADEYEEIEQEFFLVDTPQEESRLRKRRYEIAQEFTDLCRPIQIK